MGLAWFDTLGIGFASWPWRRGIDVGEAEKWLWFVGEWMELDIPGNRVVKYCGCW